MFDLVPFRRNLPRSNSFNHLLANFFDDDFFAPISNMHSFKVDLKETNQSYIVEADLPGISKEDIHLDYANNYLTISAQRIESVTDNSQEDYVRQERRYGELQRSFYIDNVKENDITAEFKNGVLRITLPKADKTKSYTHKIDIK